jgi:acyl-CoA thioesterase FadM
VTEAEVVYVAVDANRRKMRIPDNVKEMFNESKGV